MSLGPRTASCRPSHGSATEAPTSAPEPRSYWDGGYLQGGKVPEDAWGNPYQYEMPGTNNLQGFDLW